MIPVDGTVMREIAPRFSGKMAERQAEIIKEAGQVLQATLEAYEINTRLRIAHFLGQTCHESAGFRTTEEFASGAAYEGRKDLGNVKKGGRTPRQAGMHIEREPIRPTSWQLQDHGKSFPPTICTKAGATISIGMSNWRHSLRGC